MPDRSCQGEASALCEGRDCNRAECSPRIEHWLPLGTIRIASRFGDGLVRFVKDRQSAPVNESQVPANSRTACPWTLPGEWYRRVLRLSWPVRLERSWMAASTGKRGFRVRLQFVGGAKPYAGQRDWSRDLER